MKIASFNVNGVNGRLPRLLAWLEETRPDVVCLQEIKTRDDNCPAAALEQAGYGSIWHGQAKHHGVAILARGQAPREIRRGLPGDLDDTHPRYLEAEVDGLVVASIYLPNGNPQPGPKFDFKIRWFERLIHHASSLIHDSGKPTVLCGDFNVIPTDFDIYNPYWWRDDAVMQPEARDAFRRLLAQGWIDAARHLHPQERMYSFWVNANAYRRKAGMRLDMLLLTPDLAPRLRASGVDHEFRGRAGASDHAPLWVQLM